MFSSIMLADLLHCLQSGIESGTLSIMLATRINVSAVLDVENNSKYPQISPRRQIHQ